MAELFADGKHGPTNDMRRAIVHLKEVSKNIDLGLQFTSGDSYIDFLYIAMMLKTSFT